MYKGNIQDFCDKLFEYVEREYGVKFRLRQTAGGFVRKRIGGKSILTFDSSRKALYIQYDPYKKGELDEVKPIHDSADLEEQIYEFVNSILRGREHEL